MRVSEGREELSCACSMRNATAQATLESQSKSLLLLLYSIGNCTGHKLDHRGRTISSREHTQRCTPTRIHTSTQSAVQYFVLTRQHKQPDILMQSNLCCAIHGQRYELSLPNRMPDKALPM